MNVNVSPPVGDCAGAVLVNRMVWLAAVPPVELSHVPPPLSNFLFLYSAFVVPRKPVCGWFTVTLFRFATAEYMKRTTPVTMLMRDWKLKRSVPAVARFTSCHCTTSSLPTCSYRISGEPVVACMRFVPKGLIDPVYVAVELMGR